MATAFENVKGQIGACGIWCGSCVVGNGTLEALTRRVEALFRAYGLDHWGPDDLDFGQLAAGLASIQRIPACSGCWRGGGRENCELRGCATQRGLEGCAECRDATRCERAEILQHMRSGARQAGLFVQTEVADRQQLVERWTVELRAAWPCSILFEGG
jgi:hypothetical protein